MDYSDSSRSGAEDPFGPRPLSRRGVRDFTNSDSGHSARSRSSAMRPQSAYRGGTASRLGTAGFGAPPPAPPSRQATMTGFSMMDRPLTQQGLSGLRTATARGFRNRQTQDRRYWEEFLQVKVREMKAEIARLNDKVDNSEREMSAKKHYEKRVRELAQELTDLQGRLSDYNTAIRIATGEATKEVVIDQARELEESNNKLQTEVEQVFVEKQRKEMQLRQLKEQIDKERSTIHHILATMSEEQREQYEDLDRKAVALREEAEKDKAQLEQLKAEKEELSRNITGSQVKMHMVELQRRLSEAEEQRDKLKNEFKHRLQPHEEREQLLLQVREDNAAIASLDSNAGKLKEKIKKVQELIEQAEQDLEEGQSERHQKYRELKKREETMDLFMSTYEDNLQQEQDRICQLEKDIVFALEHSSSNIDIDLSEIEVLKEKDHYDPLLSNASNDSRRSVEELTKEHERLTTSIVKAEETKERLLAEINLLPEKIKVMEKELVTLSDLERLRNDGAEQKLQLEMQLDELEEKLSPTEKEVSQAKWRYEELQKKLEGNELYTKLNKLEEEVGNLEAKKQVLEDEIASLTSKTDYVSIKKEVMASVAVLNKMIIEDLNSTSTTY